MSLSVHIGIVGCSAEGAALCYRTICAKGAQLLGPHAHPEITMHTHSLAAYVEYIERNDWEGVADLMLDSANKLKNAGADFLVCPDNTIHQAMSLVGPRSPLPWLVESEVYPEKLTARGIGCLRPTDEECREINRIIMDELVYGVFRPESVTHYQLVIRRMKDEGCDAVVLGCTEIPLIISNKNSPLPVLDSTRLLAWAALKRSLAEAVKAF